MTVALSIEKELGKKKEIISIEPSMTARINPVFFMKSARSTVYSLRKWTEERPPH